LTVEEMEKIKRNADAAGLSKSAFIRFVAINSKIQVVQDAKPQAAD